MFRKSLLCLFCGIVVIALTFCQAAFAAPKGSFEWKCNIHGTSREWTYPAELWAKAMEKRTNGQFKCKVLYGAVLGPTKQNLDGIKARLFESAFMVVGYDPGKTPLMDVLNLARVMPDDTRQAALIKHSVLTHPLIANELESRWNAKVLLTDVLPTYVILSKKPIRTLEDMKGVKLRVHGGAANTIFKRIGAVPVTISPPQVYDALSKGIVEAAFFANYAHGAYRLYELAKYITTGWGLYVGAGSSVVANKDAWDALPANIKTIHHELHRESIDWWVKGFEKTDEKWISVFRKAGVKFFRLPASDQEKLNKMAEAVQRQWADRLDAKKLPGTAMLNYIRASRKAVTGY